MIRKEINAGIGHSVVELGDARHVFAAAVPCRGVTLQEQLQDVLQTIKAIFKEEGAFGSIVMQSVFLGNIENQAECQRIIRDFYGNALPATTYIAQPPCEVKLLSIEAWGIGCRADEVNIERFGDEMVIARHNGIDWAHLANVRPESTAGSVYDRSLSAFRLAGERLNRAGLRFDEVIRTWLYLGNITGMEGITNRYRELNRARTDFYQDMKFSAGLTAAEWDKPVFPASTGIGTDGNDLSIGCIAIKTNRSDVVMYPLENPQQTSAFDYAHQYGPESPKFARAMAIAAGEYVTTFISGTASITASETQHIDSVEQQTHQTLDNIEALIATDNFHCHGLPGLGATLGNLAIARVYIKHREDYANTMAICRARLGELPIIYVVGDICRPELLMEIEGIAFSQRKC
jgi:enamine deaminase RidA (YjgF/YER057c/UK114 family)